MLKNQLQATEFAMKWRDEIRKDLNESVPHEMRVLVVDVEALISRYFSGLLMRYEFRSTTAINVCE